MQVQSDNATRVSGIELLRQYLLAIEGFDRGYDEGIEKLNFTTLVKGGIKEQVAVFEELLKNSGGRVLSVGLLKYCDVLLRDFGWCLWGKSMGGGLERDWVGVYRPRDHKGTMEEREEKRRL